MNSAIVDQTGEISSLDLETWALTNGVKIVLTRGCPAHQGISGNMAHVYATLMGVYRMSTDEPAYFWTSHVSKEKAIKALARAVSGQPFARTFTKRWFGGPKYGSIERFPLFDVSLFPTP